VLLFSVQIFEEGFGVLHVHFIHQPQLSSPLLQPMWEEFGCGSNFLVTWLPNPFTSLNQPIMSKLHTASRGMLGTDVSGPGLVVCLRLASLWIWWSLNLRA
jgi:hypothetical protein